jgi:hypothetical protein
VKANEPHGIVTADSTRHTIAFATIQTLGRRNSTKTPNLCLGSARATGTRCDPRTLRSHGVFRNPNDSAASNTSRTIAARNCLFRHASVQELLTFGLEFRMMSLVRLLGFTTLACGCVTGHYRELATNREVTYVEEKGSTCDRHEHRRNHTLAPARFGMAGVTAKAS